MRRVVAIAIAAALGTPMRAQPGDGARVERVRSALRAWHEARYGAEGGTTLPSSESERRRQGLLRVWPRGGAGEAWLRDVDQLRRTFEGSFTYRPPAADTFAALAGVEVHVPPGYQPTTSSPTTVEVWQGLRPGEDVEFGRDGRRIVVRATPSHLDYLVRFHRMTVRQAAARTLFLALSTPLPARAARLWSLLEPIDEDNVQRGLFFVIGVVQRQLNVDRDRLTLLGHGAQCGTVLRAATSAPDRFAALALHEPVVVPQLGYENLTGIPILLLSSDNDGEVVTALRREVDRIDVGRIEMRSARRFGPAQVGNWLERQQRRLMRERVTLVMRPDDVVDGYWVGGISADLGDGRGGDPARIDVVADRARGLISVRARRIDRFSLLLNDELIDLDREFTIDVNDVRVTLKRSRSLSFLTQLVAERFDPRFLFTTALSIDVPRGG